MAAYVYQKPKGDPAFPPDWRARIRLHDGRNRKVALTAKTLEDAMRLAVQLEALNQKPGTPDP